MTQPIREGNQFRATDGRIWIVSVVYPGGRLWMYDAAHKRAGFFQHALVRQWERITLTEEEA